MAKAETHSLNVSEEILQYWGRIAEKVILDPYAHTNDYEVLLSLAKGLKTTLKELRYWKRMGGRPSVDTPPWSSQK